MNAVLLRQAVDELAEVRSWTCKTCETMVEETGDHCRSCAAYWQDVRDGIFDYEVQP